LRGGEYSSTSTLLQEISSLRARLKDLEDDTKSSVVSSAVDDADSPLVGMLRKDVAQLEQEKANQEKEFLNQISSLQMEHQRRMNDMHAKLRESESLNDVLNDKLKKTTMEAGELKEMLDRSVSDEAEYFKGRLAEAQAEIEVLSGKVHKAVKDGEASRNKTEIEEKYMRLLEEQHDTHMKEIEQMKENLASADMEIAESREEIDALQEEVMELQQYRETLIEEVTSARVDHSDEKRVSQALKNEISQQKLSIEKLQHELKEKDVRLDQKFEEIARLKKNSTATPDVKKLQQEIETKGATISRLQEELGEKNETIQNLEGHKQTLLAEITELKVHAQTKPTVGTPLTVDTSGAPGAPDDNPISPAEKQQLVKDVVTLEERLVRFHSKLADRDGIIDDLKTSLAEERKTTKKLRAEIRELKNNTNSPTPLSEKQECGGAIVGDRSELVRLREQNQRLAEEIKALRASPVAKRKPSVPSSPRIVVPPPALNRTASTRDLKSPRTPVSGLVATFERGFGSKDADNNNNNANLLLEESEEASTLSPIESATVTELQEKLSREKELVRQLQQELRSEKETIANLQKKSGHTSPTALVNELAESRREIERLEAKLRDTEQSQSRRKIADLEQENKLQRTEFAGTKIRSVFQEEKKTIAEAELDELVALRAQLTKKEKALQRLRAKHSTYEEESEEALDRLRNQVEALQSELGDAMTKIERLENEAACYEAGKRTKAAYDADIERMELELTMTKARHAELENEHAAKVEELEKKIGDLEQANLDLSTEVPADAQKQFDEEAGTLTTELTKSQMKLADLEMEHTMKIKSLEDGIKTLTAELEEKKTENENLQKALTEAAAKFETHAETEAKSQREHDTEINRMSVELTKAQMDKADNERIHFERLKELEGEIEALESEAEKELDAKQDEIDVLKEELKRKEDSIKRLEDEKTKLCSNMSDVSSSRKDEIQELQDEILDLTTQTKSQAREIQSLKMKIEEHEARKEASMAKAQQRIRELEEETRELQHVDRDAVLELKTENMQLRETIREVKLERRSLKERLESFTQEKSSSKSAQVLRERNSALKEEVEKLTKRLKKMEDSITRFAI